MERIEEDILAEAMIELYDVIHHLTRVVKDLTRVIQEHDKTTEELANVVSYQVKHTELLTEAIVEVDSMLGMVVE